MLILYKPFRFSDIKFTEIDQNVGYYKKNRFFITVIRVSTSPDLYDFYICSEMRDDKVAIKVTEAEIEAYVNKTIMVSKHVSTI